MQKEGGPRNQDKKRITPTGGRAGGLCVQWGHVTTPLALSLSRYLPPFKLFLSKLSVCPRLAPQATAYYVVPLFVKNRPDRRNGDRWRKWRKWRENKHFSPPRLPCTLHDGAPCRNLAFLRYVRRSAFFHRFSFFLLQASGTFSSCRVSFSPLHIPVQRHIKLFSWL